MFNRQLDKFIAESGFTQCELARKAGISQGTISQIVNGVRNPRIRTQYKLAEALDCDVKCLQRMLRATLKGCQNAPGTKQGRA